MATQYIALILLFSFGITWWALIPTIRRWGRNKQSLKPLFVRSIIVCAIPILLGLVAAEDLVNTRGLVNDRSFPFKSPSSSSDPQTRELAGKLEAALQLPPTSQKSLTLGALAVDIALAGKPRLAELACRAIEIDSVRNTARYKCALILGRQGLTSEATEIASRISVSSLKRTALLKIARGEFDDNSIPPPAQ